MLISENIPLYDYSDAFLERMSNECSDAFTELTGILLEREKEALDFPKGCIQRDLYEWGMDAAVEFLQYEDDDEIPKGFVYRSTVLNIQKLCQDRLVDSLHHETLKDPVLDREWVWERADLKRYLSMAKLFPELKFQGISPIDGERIIKQKFPLGQEIARWVQQLPSYLLESNLEAAVPIKKPFPAFVAINTRSTPADSTAACMQLWSYRELGQQCLLRKSEREKTRLLEENTRLQQQPLKMEAQTEQSLAIVPYDSQTQSTFDLADWLSEADEQLDIVAQSRLERRNRRAKDFEEQITHTVEAIQETCTQKIDLLQKESSEKLEEEKKRTEALQAQLAAYGQKQGELEKTCDKGLRKAEELSRRARVLREELQQEKYIVKTLHTTVSQHQAEIRMQDQRINAQKNHINSTQQLNNQLASEVAQQARQVDEGKYRLKQAESNQEKLKSHLDQQRKVADSLTKEKQVLQNELGNLHNAIHHQQAHINNLENALNNTKKSKCTIS